MLLNIPDGGGLIISYTYENNNSNPVFLRKFSSPTGRPLILTNRKQIAGACDITAQHSDTPTAPTFTLFIKRGGFELAYGEALPIELWTQLGRAQVQIVLQRAREFQQLII